LLASNIPAKQDSFVHTGLNTRTDNHEYKIVAIDSCGNVSDTSTTHLTMELHITVGQLIHNLFWTPYQGYPVQNYIIQFRQAGTWQNVDTVPGTTTSLMRIPVPCNHQLFYRVVA